MFREAVMPLSVGAFLIPHGVSAAAPAASGLSATDPVARGSMNEETQNVELETENQAGDHIPEGGEGTEVSQEQTPELSPYEKQLAEIRAEKERLEQRLQEKEKQLEIKDKALKKKTSVQEPTDIEARLQNLLKKELSKRDADTLIRSVTTDKAAQELIRHHLEHTIQPTGDVEKDVEMAWAIANAGVMKQIIAKQTAQESYEDLVSSMQAGSTVAGNTTAQSSKNPVMRQAEELLKKINPEALKHLNK